MFQQRRRKTTTQGAFDILELIYHASVRNVRKNHGNAVIGLLLNLVQTVLMVAVFWVMFELLGMRRNAIRGDFLLYLMSGIFLFFTHTKTVGAVAGADGPTSPMMKHAPMNTIISITSAALGALYLQLLAGGMVLFFYHAAVTPITIEDPVGALGMLMLSWVSGIGVGMVFLAIKPWSPDLVRILVQVYQRANMIASGKMFVANTMPGYLLVFFDWNPLFHAIDQARGFIFINYNPHYTSISYPIYVTLVCLMVGLMGEFYTRRHASISWGARR
ncbi:ABC transporter permease [Ruixingdingia sedimenti]|uniref:ABC transporter permease n=1 Tax=Ruixingdingia sedimenti TaxID=3073604 RepID=A0ABU1F940_9RHOB|nr:ABC transporter permease [Xinfangfangia sp. LG-4]MDR5653098.1 ABC transporter permease [Xinfangfangia sp. LG-4]